MSNERDELARIIERDDLYNDTGCCDWIVADKAADAILAAGYRKPRTVTTAAELRDLDAGSVVLDERGKPWINDGDDSEEWADVSSMDSLGGPIWRGSSDIPLPATVIHEATA